jgi:hypothetical protein
MMKKKGPTVYIPSGRKEAHGSSVRIARKVDFLIVRLNYVYLADFQKQSDVMPALVLRNLLRTGPSTPLARAVCPSDR